MKWRFCYRPNPTQNVDFGMKNTLPRTLLPSLVEALSESPAVALLGPRQCGKTTLALQLRESIPDIVHLDLERPADLAKLADPEFFLSRQKGRLVCIDEVQRRPDLFPILRALCDEDGGAVNGRFLLLGSASRDLIRQSSETLAGRITFLRLTPLLFSERPGVDVGPQVFRGGFPRSALAPTDAASTRWRESFVRTFLERDLLLWRGFAPESMRRLWTMLAHDNGETANFARLGGSLGVSDQTVRRYVDLLHGAFMVDPVPPAVSNLGKRLVKSPRVYLADTGIAATLLGIRSFEEMYSHPGWGHLWEAFVLAQLRGLLPDAEISFYRTKAGAEIDFGVARGGRTVAVECKASTDPSVGRGNTDALDDIRPDRAFVAAPVESSYPLNPRWTVVSPGDLGRLFDPDFLR